MPGLHLAGTCVALVLAAWDEPPIVGEAPIAGGSESGGSTTGDPTTGTTGTSGATGSTSTETGTTTAGTTTSGTSGTSSGDDSSSSDGSSSDDSGTNDDASASATSPTTTATDSGGSFVEGDITGISYGYEDFEGSCYHDDEDPGCCDSDQNNSDNFCHISRRGRDRVAIAVMLVLLARPRRKRR